MTGIKPISFKDALDHASSILKDRTQKSSWFGKKIFLGYSDKAGWKIHELGLFARILRGLNLAYHDTHRKHVKNQLTKLTEEEARLISEKKLTRKFPSLERKFKEVYTSKKLQESPQSQTSRSSASTTSSASSTTSLSSSSPPVEGPLYLSNYRASRCYLDSVLEIMLSQEGIRERIFQTYERIDVKSIQDRLDALAQLSKNKETEKSIEQLQRELAKKAILEKLRDLILLVHETKGSGKGAHSPEGEASAGEKIRKAIFDSRLNADLRGNANRYTQQDAATALLLINDLLDNTFETVEVDTPFSMDKSFARPVEENHKLEIALEKGWQYDLQTLIAHTFASKQSKDSRSFELEDGSESELPYTTQTQLLSLPDSLALHLVRHHYDRTKGRVSKLREPVTLPKDGIVDLTPYYSGTKVQGCRYEMTGYVIHHGSSLEGGHYTANIKIGDKYYECDDLNPGFHREISRREFYGNRNAYLVMLKRIPQDNSPSLADD